LKPKAKRLVVKALLGHRCYKASERGIHEKWKCPPTCGKHTTSVPRHNEITAGEGTSYDGPGGTWWANGR